MSRNGTSQVLQRRERQTKGHTLQSRIPGDLYEALRAEADRKGCSVSQVAWLWLEFARKLKPSEETV